MAGEASPREASNVVTAVLGDGPHGQQINPSRKTQEGSASSLECQCCSRACYRRADPDRGLRLDFRGGYRNFPANLILPQVTSTDGFWFTPMTQPFQGVAPMMGMAPTSDATTRQSSFPLTYSKMITQELGIQLSDGLERDDRRATHRYAAPRTLARCCNTRRTVVRGLAARIRAVDPSRTEFWLDRR